MVIGIVYTVPGSGAYKMENKTKLDSEIKMRGIGGPLLTIGDLLSDVGGETVTASDSSHSSSPSSLVQDSNSTPHSLDLTKLFQVLFFIYIFMFVFFLSLFFSPPCLTLICSFFN